MWLRIGGALCVLLFSIQPVGAQDVSNWFIRSGISTAHVLPVSPFETHASIDETPISWVPDLTFEIGRETDGKQEWHHRYGFPSYGVGFSVARFRNGVEHGRPLEAYTFFSWPFATLNEQFAVTTDFAMGLSWNWRQVDDRTASATEVLGSNLNALIDWGFYLRYRSTPRLAVYSGIDFTHRSNGGVTQPNKGINTLGPKVSVQYGFGRTHPRRTPVESPAFRPAWELIVGSAGGMKTIIDWSGTKPQRDVGVLDTTIGVQRHFYRYGKIVGGADLTYTEPWSTGVYGGYEHLIGRFGAFVQLGYNVARGASDDARYPRAYQRYGWRMRFADPLWAVIAVRATEFNRAECLELGAGYSIRFDRPRAQP